MKFKLHTPNINNRINGIAKIRKRKKKKYPYPSITLPKSSE